jgi:hypothetical protein
VEVPSDGEGVYDEAVVIGDTECRKGKAVLKNNIYK